MYASELIEKLKEEISRRGDNPVFINGEIPVENVQTRDRYILCRRKHGVTTTKEFGTTFRQIEIS